DMTTSNRREFLRVTAGGLTLAGLVGRASAAGAEATIRPGGHDVLLVVDVQNCFVPGGSLAVNGGDEIVPIINRIAPAFRNGLRHVYLVGLATDFCVGWSALDARKAGFAATVIEDATRGIDAGGSLAKAWADMTGAGVKRIKSADIAV